MLENDGNSFIISKQNELSRYKQSSQDLRSFSSLRAVNRPQNWADYPGVCARYYASLLSVCARASVQERLVQRAVEHAAE